MTVSPIRAILFDMGGTLEDLYYDEEIRREATRGLQQLLAERGVDPGLSLIELKMTVLSGIDACQAWREEHEIELPPERVWTEFIFPDHNLSREPLLAAAEDLALYYETHFHVRKLRPEVPAVLAVLRQRGFELGIISNVSSRQLVPLKLAEYGIDHYFRVVMTSSALGRRKPNALLFEEAARQLRLPPSACAYVGDTISRDVIGARRAGYGLAIQIKSFLTARADRCTYDVRPDAIIHDLDEVIDLVTSETETAHGS
jgi:putative hydrolase of the HAD superfamily